ncbi:UNVERIFIED_CONTAM: hypothetical protein K2H54_073162 [Gekko kuhli]
MACDCPARIQLLLLLLLLWALGRLAVLSMHMEPGGPDLEPSGDGGLLLPGSGRVKRGWVWNQFFVVEEYTGTEPLYVGKGSGVVRQTPKGPRPWGVSVCHVWGLGPCGCWVVPFGQHAPTPHGR